MRTILLAFYLLQTVAVLSLWRARWWLRFFHEHDDYKDEPFLAHDYFACLPHTPLVHLAFPVACLMAVLTWQDSAWGVVVLPVCLVWWGTFCRLVTHPIWVCGTGLWADLQMVAGWSAAGLRKIRKALGWGCIRLGKCILLPESDRTVARLTLWGRRLWYRPYYWMLHIYDTRPHDAIRYDILLLVAYWWGLEAWEAQTTLTQVLTDTGYDDVDDYAFRWKYVVVWFCLQVKSQWTHRPQAVRFASWVADLLMHPHTTIATEVGWMKQQLCVDWDVADKTPALLWAFTTRRGVLVWVLVLLRNHVGNGEFCEEDNTRAYRFIDNLIWYGVLNPRQIPCAIARKRDEIRSWGLWKIYHVLHFLLKRMKVVLFPLSGALYGLLRAVTDKGGMSMEGQVFIHSWQDYSMYSAIQILLVLVMQGVLFRKHAYGDFQGTLRTSLLSWGGVVLAILFFDLGRSMTNAAGVPVKISFALWYLETGITCGYYIVMTCVFSCWKAIWRETRQVY